MGGAASLTLPTGDAISNVETFVNVFVTLYGLLILVYILMSWIRMPYSVWLNRIQRFLYDTCEPYLRIFRRILPSAGGLDLSPIVAFLMLGAIDRLLIWILEHFH